MLFYSPCSRGYLRPFAREEKDFTIKKIRMLLTGIMVYNGYRMPCITRVWCQIESHPIHRAAVFTAL